MEHMFQQLKSPKSEAEFRKLQDNLYAITKEKVQNGSVPSFKGLLDVAKSSYRFLYSQN